MGSGSSVAAQEIESNQLPNGSSVASNDQPSSAKASEVKDDSQKNDSFTPPEKAESGEEDVLDLVTSASQTFIQTDVQRLHADGPPLTEGQESMIKSCLVSLEKLLKDSHLTFDVSNILPQTTVIHEDEGGDTQLLAHVGEGLFVVDKGTIDLLAPCSKSDDEIPVIRLTEGDYCGEYSTLFNVPFRTKIQFKSSIDLLHIPADVVRMNMHFTGQLDREAMLSLSIVQSNLLSSELLGEDISSRVVVKCLKASLFSGLREDALNALAETVSPLLFNDGEIVYSEGESAAYVFLVLKGMVQFVTKGQHHATHKVNYSTEGVSLAAKEFFGGSILLHQATACGPLLLASVGREQILDMLYKFPESASEVKNIAQRP